MTPVVTVIVPHHLNTNQAYLSLCLKSLLLSKEIEYQVILVSSSMEKAIVPDNPRLVHLWDKSRVGVREKIEVAFEIIHPATQYIILVSDDVVVSQYLLVDMANGIGERELIMNPFSNSDCRALYEADLKLKKITPDGDIEYLPIYPDLDIHYVEGWEKSIIEYPRGKKLLVPFPTLSFYCTMMPQSVWKKIGSFDSQLELRFNDTDYCLRARQLGIHCVVNFGTFAFHFGSRTIRQMATPETQQACSNHFMKKWNIK